MRRIKNSCECLAIHQPTADMTVSSVQLLYVGVYRRTLYQGSSQPHHALWFPFRSDADATAAPCELVGMLSLSPIDCFPFLLHPSFFLRTLSFFFSFLFFLIFLFLFFLPIFVAGITVKPSCANARDGIFMERFCGHSLVAFSRFSVYVQLVPSGPCVNPISVCYKNHSPYSIALSLHSFFSRPTI